MRRVAKNPFSPPTAGSGDAYYAGPRPVVPNRRAAEVRIREPEPRPDCAGAQTAMECAYMLWLPQQEATPTLQALPFEGVYDNRTALFEQFGRQIVYGLVATLRADTKTNWRLFEHRFQNDEVIHATFGEDAETAPAQLGLLPRSTLLICNDAIRFGRAIPENWSVALRFVRWRDTELWFAPKLITRADCT